MLKDTFIGKPPSQFQVNPLVRAFILAEMMIWSSWNLIQPIFALYAITIPGGNIETAASAFSVHLIVRVFGELISGRILTDRGELAKFCMAILGILIWAISYLGFAFTTNMIYVFIFYGVAGLGIGLATPAKNSLFSSHIDKEKDAMEWGMMDATVFFCISLASLLGGFIASKYGFRPVFFLAFVITLLGTLPFILYIKHEDTLYLRLKQYISKRYNRT